MKKQINKETTIRMHESIEDFEARMAHYHESRHWKKQSSKTSVENFITMYLDEHFSDTELDSLIIDTRLSNYSQAYLEV